jgi:hypothetical protein
LLASQPPLLTTFDRLLFPGASLRACFILRASLTFKYRYTCNFDIGGCSKTSSSGDGHTQSSPSEALLPYLLLGAVGLVLDLACEHILCSS